MSRTHLEVGVNKTVDRKRRKFLRKKSVLKRVACSEVGIVVAYNAVT